MWSRPRSVRHVWVRFCDLHPQQPPDAGVVVWWKKDPELQWMAFVIVVRAGTGDDPMVVQEWVPASDVRPAGTDPNRAFGLR